MAPGRLVGSPSALPAADGPVGVRPVAALCPRTLGASRGGPRPAALPPSAAGDGQGSPMAACLHTRSKASS